MLSRYQIEQLEGLFRQAVRLRVNPAGGPAACEMGCGRIGTEAHHLIHRGQEPVLRLKYEPRFACLLCRDCHGAVHADEERAILRLLGILRMTNPAKSNWLSLYIERHDRMHPPDVSWQWQRSYLRRCILRAQRHWADAYNQDIDYSLLFTDQ